MDHHAHTQAACRGRLRLAPVALALALALRGVSALAADPQLYEVTIAPTGNGALDQAAHDSSTLVSLRESAPVGPFALIGRARGDADRLQSALNSFGYYKGQVAITIAGRGLDDPGLPGVLDAMPDGRAVPVAVTLTPGPLFHLRHVELTGDPTPAARDALRLAPGDPARAADVLAARGRMQTALLDTGHALARVGAPVATLVPADNALDVSFPVEAGPRVDIGHIAISGEDRLDPAYISRRLRLQPGDPFDPAAIEKARQDLAAVPAIGGVRIIPSDTLDAEGRLPMRVEVSERPRRAVDFGAAFSTDQGGSLSASWTHRDLFGEAEQLTLGAAVTQLGGTASQQPGYNAFATYIIPDWLRRGQSLTFNLQAVREYLEAYDRTAAIAGAALARRLTDEITVSGGLLFTKEQIVQEGVTTNYTLFQVPLAVRYDTTTDLFDPTQGIRSALTLTPTYSLGGGDTPNATFLIAQLSASTYLDIGNWIAGTEGRSILALRGLIGTISGARVFELPPDQRFYAGGGGSIRGFRFQSVGPQFADGHPTGGNAVDTGSIEFRQRFGANWGAAMFVDAGQVGTNGVPFNGRVAVGAGAGVRYFTPIGPIRADFAVPITKETKGDAFEIYIGIGQAF
jgi:translocation and assembly module TamA